MKKLCLILTFGLLLTVTIRLVAQDENPVGQNSLFTEGWQIVSSGVEENLFSIHFANSTTGFIGGSLSRCLKSTNGGLSWTAVSVPSYADFEAVWATSANDAYLGAWDSVYATHNGGLNWIGAYTNPTSNYAVHDLQFLSPDNGFAFMTWSQMGVTTNGGDSWAVASGGGFEALDFFGGYMLDQNTGWAVGDLSLLAKTTDGGVSWTPYDWDNYMNYTGIQLRGVHATSELNAWVVADSGIAFRTTDGGITWSRNIIAGEEDRLTDVFFLNADQGYITGYNGKIFKTMDGGDNWTQEPQLTTYNLNSVFFVNDKLGWAVGENGTILRYQGTQGGLNRKKVKDDMGMVISPNPVNDGSMVSVQIREKNEVKIEIIDYAGRNRYDVHLGSLEKGSYKFPLNLSNISNGIYLCQLTTGDLSVSKPFIVTHYK